MQTIQLGNIKIDVELKDVKNIHLSVYPPNGAVRIAAPTRMKLDTIRIFALDKLKWIKKQQKAFKQQSRETPREYIQRESHYLFGKRFMLKINVVNQSPSVEIEHNILKLNVKQDTSADNKAKILEEFYRQQLKEIVPELISKWEKIIGVKSNEFGIKKMRTKWGSCNTEAKRIWLNLELAKKPKICLEYIIVHELVHLIERSHNALFVTLMNKYMPNWRLHREELNRLPFKHLDWKY